MNFRVLGKGVLGLPNRSNNEVVIPPPGYECSPYDSNIFVRIMPKCEHRTTQQIRKTCCGLVNCMFCSKYGKVTNRNECAECPG
jgi:hypothetical protein